MIDITQSIAEGKFTENDDGTFTVYGEVEIYTHDIATSSDVATGKAWTVGMCINRRLEKHKVEVIIDTLNPQVRAGETIQVENFGLCQIFNIESDGHCEIWPAEGQDIAIPHSGTEYRLGNIYQLKSGMSTANILY